jgi:hypothetical protein
LHIGIAEEDILNFVDIVLANIDGQILAPIIIDALQAD